MAAPWASVVSLWVMVVIVSGIILPPGVAPVFDVHFELGDNEGLSVLYLPKNK